MAEIISLPGANQPSEKPEPVAAVIRTLETLLEEAKRGEIRALAVALVRNEETTAEGWSPGRGPYSHHLMASISDLQFRYARFRARNQDVLSWDEPA